MRIDKQEGKQEKKGKVPLRSSVYLGHILNIICYQFELIPTRTTTWQFYASALKRIQLLRSYNMVQGHHEFTVC